MAMRTMLLAGLVSGCLALACPAKAQQVQTIADPAFVNEVARGYGSAVIEKDSDGDPMIKCKSEGIGYSISFYSCKSNQNCKSIQMRSGFSHKGVKIEKINEWNQKKRFARAALDNENDPILRMDFNFDGGVTREALDNALGIWTSLLKSYVEHIGYKR